MSDMFVQDILDPEELERRDAWNKRLDLPILVSLDNYFRNAESSDSLLSGEFVQKIDPDAYRINDNLTEQNIENLDRFNPVFSLLVDGTGHKNNLPDNVLPNDQLIVNRKKYDDPELFISNAKLLLNTPFSNNGIGKRSKDQDFGFSKDHPFYIFVCAYNDSELRQYMNEILTILKDFPENLVKVVGFLVPIVG